MTDLVNVIVKEDDSIEKQLNKTAKKLKRKYTKKRRINEKLLAKKSPVEKVFSGIFTALCILMVVVSGIMCFSNIVSRIQRVSPSIFGYCNMKIATRSMQSTFPQHSIVVVHSVDTDSLNVGDVIAFYQNPQRTAEFNNLKRSDPDSIKLVQSSGGQNTKSKTKLTLTLASVFGIQNADVKNSASNPDITVSTPIFHRIQDIYEDAQGRRWFNTKGDDNGYDDSSKWIVCETTVIGIYTNSLPATAIKTILGTISSGSGMIISLIVPLVFLAIIIIPSAVKDVQIAMLELDVVEEKRKLTDDICVRNNVGFQMDTKTKFKVLATAPDGEKLHYISLLWEEGTAPSSIKKFYLRKEINLSSISKLRDVNRECEKMFKDNVAMTKIAKYYLTEKKKIEKEQEEYKKIWKKMRKQYSEETLKNDMFN